jgi:hypothetical protein
VEPIRSPTLFETEKSEQAGNLANSLSVERPFSLPGILLGTSAFTAAGWPGSFYPQGLQPRDFLPYYATQFGTVEVDSTFYRTPSVSTVNGWHRLPIVWIYPKKAGTARHGSQVSGAARPTITIQT